MTLAWTTRASPFDSNNTPGRSAYSPSLNRIVVVGSAGGLPEVIQTSDDGGVTWTIRSSPMNGNVAKDVAWSPSLSLFVVVGLSIDASVTVMTSPDGINWTQRGDPFNSGASGNTQGLTVEWDATAAIFVAGSQMGDVGAYLIITSANGTSWTGRSTPWDAAATSNIFGLTYSTALSKWIGVGWNGALTKSGLQSVDNGVTWTQLASGPFDGGFPQDVIVAADGTVVVCGASSGFTNTITRSPDLSTWTPVTSPFTNAIDNGIAISLALSANDDLLLCAGTDRLGVAVAESADNGATWTADTCDLTTGNGVGFADAAGVVVACGTNDDASITTITAGDAPPPPPTPGRGRFYKGYKWRAVITDLNSSAITCFERLAMNRSVIYRLNQPAYTAAQVPSDDPRVNIPHFETGLDAPSLSFNDRLCYLFREEHAGTPTPWVCRFAGIVMQIEDAAQADQPYSNFTAYDPWQYLFARAVKNGTSLVGEDGISWTDTRGDVIVTQLLENTIDVDGPCHIELSTFEETAQIDINFQQGTSVGDALRQLVATNTLDIVFEPIYDPDNRPGICSRVKVYQQAGDVQPTAIMSLGVGRQIGGISSLLDGQQMANDVQYYNGQGGDPVTPQTNAASQARYGVWTAQQFFPAKLGDEGAAWVEAVAALQLDLRKQGRRSVTLTPASLIAPIPLLDYTLGDKVPVYATARLRQPIPWQSDATIYQRIYGIPIMLSDDGVETVRQLVASPDGFS